MSLPQENAVQNRSPLAGYCAEIEKLVKSLTGMLSQNAALGMPLGDDREAVARLEPLVRRLDQAITVSLTTSDAAPCEPSQPCEPITPQTRASGARVLDFGSSAAPSHSDPQHVKAPPPVAETSPEPTPITAPPPPATEEMPSIVRCADLLMEYLCVEANSQCDHDVEVTLQGTNKSLPIPAVFEFLGRASKTGELRVKTNDETLIFEFVRGDIVFSSTDSPPEGQRLGEIMVDRGMVTADELEQFLTHHDDSARLGSALESEEFIALPVLREALEIQMRNRLDRAFHASESAFTFSEGGPENPDQRVRMSVPQLLLEQID